MTDIKWTKTYDLAVDNRHFRVYVSEQVGNGFHASCLWYEKGRLLKASSQSGALQFQLMQQHAQSETEALSQILNWVENTFGEQGVLTASEG